MTPSESRARRSHRQRGRGTDQVAAPGGWRGAPIVVLLVAAALVGWSTTRDAEPAAPPPKATELPLNKLDLTCPAVGTAKLSSDRAGIGFTRPPAAESSNTKAPTDGAGGLEITPIPRGDALSPESPPKPGAWQVLKQDADASETVVMSATGALATGFSAYAATSASEEAGGGQAVAACAAPGREAWFVGAGSAVDHSSMLLVSNPGDTEAIVDVSVLTGKDTSDPVSGLVVGPHEVVELDLAEFAADEGDVAVRVAASQGQIAASLLDHWTATLAPAGTEWIPPVQSPSTSLAVSPLIDGADRRELIVGNPGERTASVDIQVMGADGTFPVPDFEDVSVHPGTVEVVSVPGSLDRQLVGLRLDSDQPIVAAARSISPGSPADVAYGTSLPEVTGSAVVPVDLPTVDPSGLSLAVSSAVPEKELTFSITAYDDEGASLTERSLTVSPGATGVWQADRRQDLGTKLKRVAYLVVTPTSGSLRASAIYASDDESWAAIPLQDAPVDVLAPGVYPLE